MLTKTVFFVEQFRCFLCTITINDYFSIKKSNIERFGQENDPKYISEKWLAIQILNVFARGRIMRLSLSLTLSRSLSPLVLIRCVKGSLIETKAIESKNGLCELLRQNLSA